MENQNNDVLEIILRECAAAGPRPWYPADYARLTGVSRDRLDPALDNLRLGGLLRLTEWVQGKGQGYALTDAGAQILENPRSLQRLRRDGVPPEPPPPLRPVTVQTTTWDRGEAIRASLLQPRPPVVTFVLIAINVVVFLLGEPLAQQGTDLVRLANVNRAVVVARDEWWRMLTYCFVHAGILHIGMNMFALWTLGSATEPLFGPIRFLLLYLIAGVGGGYAVVLSGESAPTVGASGCICGLLAAMGVWVFLNRSYLPPAGVARWFRSFMMNVFLIVIISMIPHVSWLGHLGGAVGGAVAAVPLVYNRFGLRWQRHIGLAGVIAIPVVCVLTAVATVTPSERAPAVRARVLELVEEDVVPVYNEYAVPFLTADDPADLFKDKERIAKARRAFANAQESLTGAKQLLQTLPPAAKNSSKTIEELREYVRTWSGFFDSFQKILDRGTQWTAEEYDELTAEVRNMRRIRKLLLPRSS